jgi:hypothetical protein
MKRSIKNILLLTSVILLGSDVLAEDAKTADPSKTGKKTANSIFGIKLKQDKPRQNKLLDAANDLVSGKKKSADRKEEAKNKK